MVVPGLLAAERSLPSFVVLLVLLIAVGIGPFAGMLSFSIGSIGMFGKLFADAIEQADKGIFESIQSVGGTKLQLIRYAILPEVVPSFIANLFYAFDVNLRAAIPLGVFGGGGIGFEFDFVDRLPRYKDMLAYGLIIIVLITRLLHTSNPAHVDRMALNSRSHSCDETLKRDCRLLSFSNCSRVGRFGVAEISIQR
jgi:phosphonate transport system permease protein